MLRYLEQVGKATPVVAAVCVSPVLDLMAEYRRIAAEESPVCGRERRARARARPRNSRNLRVSPLPPLRYCVLAFDDAAGVSAGVSAGEAVEAPRLLDWTPVPVVDASGDELVRADEHSFDVELSAATTAPLACLRLRVLGRERGADGRVLAAAAAPAPLREARVALALYLSLIHI